MNPDDDGLPEASGHEADVIFCTQCGQRNRENNYTCTRCGFELHGVSPPRYAVTDDSTMGGLIPYKNPQALWSYYLGVFSMIPCLGIPLGIAAVILGIMGLKYADVHAGSRGKVHAWIGIILGGGFTLAYTTGIIVFVTSV